MKKNLIIKQHDLTDCGPACLLSVIIYYGGYVPIEIIRTNSLTDKVGTSAYNLINCAKKYGLSGSGIKLESIDNISKDKLPCIAHLNYSNGLNHFVVIYEINKHDLIIMDPSKGKVKISKESFANVFSGVIILLHPCAKLPKLNKPDSIKKLFVSTLLDNKSNTISLFIVSLLLIVISLFLNYFLKIGSKIINKGFGLTSLVYFFLLYLVLYILKNIFEFIKNKLIIILNKNVSFKLYSDFSKKIFSLPLIYIKSRTSGEIISRFSELSEVNNLLPTIILSVSIDLIMALITLIFSFQISHNLTFIVLTFMLVYFIIAYAFKNPTLRKINKNLDENAEFNSKVIESVNNLRSIKNLNNDLNMRKRIEKYAFNALEDNYKLDSYYNRVSLLKNMFYDLMVLFVSSFGLYLIYLNKINIVDLFTFIMILNYFTEPIKDLIDMITKFCFIKTSIIKLNEFSISNDIEKSFKDFSLGDIKVNNISYAYNGIDYVIKNYSCLIKAKSKVLVQGNSGSGKSTLCQLISKQLTNYEGEILIHNNNIKDIKNDSLRKSITYIGQKDSLLIDTIENNIKYERNVDKEEFKTICEICEIDKIVDKKFNQFNSFISESSDNISGGEKQRITLARGLINSGKILILDESLSEVNKDMEERIIKNIINYFKDKTIIYVSHKKYKNIFDKVIRV